MRIIYKIFVLLMMSLFGQGWLSKTHLFKIMLKKKNSLTKNPKYKTRKILSLKALSCMK